MTELQFGTDSQGRNAFAPRFSSFKVHALIPTLDYAEVEVPSLDDSTKIIAAFSYPTGGSFWVALNGMAGPPENPAFMATNSEGNPAQREVKAGDIISVFNSSTSDKEVGICYYSSP